MIRFYKDLTSGHRLELIEVNLRTNAAKFEDIQANPRTIITTTLKAPWLEPIAERAA